VLHFTLVRSKLEYASVLGNSITSTDASKLERIQRKFACVCFYRFSPHVPCSYTFALEKLSLHSLRKRRHHLDILVVLFRSIMSLNRVLPIFWTSCSYSQGLFSNKPCPSPCAYAAKAVGKDLGIFAIGAVSFSYILKRGSGM
jgi:hypothetical protein